MFGTPVAEVEIDEAVVRALLRDQCAKLADLPLQQMDAGWDNAMFRLGDSLTVRLPRRRQAVALLINEQNWLPTLIGHLSIRVPSPVHIGRPGASYPWPWSILPWLNGSEANETPPNADQALRLSAFLRDLHQIAPDNAPINEFRGCPLSDRVDGMAVRLNHLSKTGCIVPEVRFAWEQGLQAPTTSRNCWLHGDLHARNVLVDDGAISAIIDWGDITSGDAATDLASVWMLFEDADARQNALSSYGASEPETIRARAWAVSFGTMLLASGLIDHPRHAKMGSNILRRVVEDVTSGR